MPSTSSPAPAPSASLADLIAQRIRREGPLAFRDYMEMALYHPELGYYSNCDPSLDYQSSPNVHPVFGWCIARQLTEIWRALDRPARFDVLECGAGSGRFAADVVSGLQRAAPDCADALRYRLQDRSYEAQARRQSVLESVGPAFVVEAGLPEAGGLNGCVLSNELIDAFPVHRVRLQSGRLLELCAGLEGERFVDVECEASSELHHYFDHLGLMPAEGCEADVNLEAAPWLRKAAACLDRGYVLTLDYGYEAAEMYSPARPQGTLLTFYRHTAGSDPYARPGRQDITASVDFTSLMRAGVDVGLSTLGFVTQAEYLAALGIREALEARPSRNEMEAHHALRRAALELTDPDGLGRIKVLLQGKGAPAAAPFASEGGYA
ncbi:MAG TPA: SAM-dependent methyltransferase [Dehalococcoidia bacterium]